MYHAGGVSEGVYSIYLFLKGLGYTFVKDLWKNEHGGLITSIPQAYSTTKELTEFIHKHYSDHPEASKVIFKASNNEQLYMLDEIRKGKRIQI
jgi:hypothetical protein